MALREREARVEARRGRIGTGLYATDAIPAGATILRIRGRVLHWRVILRRKGPGKDNCYRFGPETYLDPGDDVSRYVNHSCVPNAGVRKVGRALYLFAAKSIRAGAEITFDYSTITGDDDIWTLRCRCGRSTCRNVVRNFGSLPLPLQRRYVRAGMVPAFILATFDESPGRRATPNH
ncbi:MAG TPA: SET domain-containing protein [Gemmatimonadaceae bacterium]|jgi:SET domain-containing protein